MFPNRIRLSWKDLAFQKRQKLLSFMHTTYMSCELNLGIKSVSSCLSNLNPDHIADTNTTQHIDEQESDLRLSPIKHCIVMITQTNLIC